MCEFVLQNTCYPNDDDEQHTTKPQNQGTKKTAK